MKNNTVIPFTPWLAALLMILAIAPALSAAQKKNKKNTDNSENPVPLPPLPTPQELDNSIGEMLGAWQIGDIDAMHKYYADDATFTSGAYEPPIVGWANYVVAYQKQRQRIQGMQFIRRNTSIFFRSDFAWASYQWEFDGTVDNKSMVARGQTTLIFAKTGDRWLIVHNHTSQICDASAPMPAVAPQPAPAAAPAKPGL